MHKMLAEEIIVKPIITEKSNDAMQEGKYTFKVAKNATKNMEEEEPLDVNEAAKLVKKKAATIYTYCSMGLIPFHKSGGRNIFYRSELLIWLKDTSKKG